MTSTIPSKAYRSVLSALIKEARRTCGSSCYPELPPDVVFHGHMTHFERVCDVLQNAGLAVPVESGGEPTANVLGWSAYFRVSDGGSSWSPGAAVPSIETLVEALLNVAAQFGSPPPVRFDRGLFTPEAEYVDLFDDLVEVGLFERDGLAYRAKARIQHELLQ